MILAFVGFAEKGNHIMRAIVAMAVVGLGLAMFDEGKALGQVYAYPAPTVVQSYYAPAPVVYPAPVVWPVRRYVYAPVVGAPVVVPAPVVVGTPVLVARPAVIGPAGKVYIVGRPIRNVVRAVVP